MQEKIKFIPMLQEYAIGSRDYLKRARARLDEEKIESLFYAALELRLGIEARLHEYNLRVPKTNKREKIWRIGKIAKKVEGLFGGDKEIQVKFHDPETGEKFPALYTPVSKSLQKNGERLGQFLHHPRKANLDVDYLKEFKHLLEETYKGLLYATSGIMLGPILQDQHDKMSFRFERGINPQLDKIAHKVGDTVRMDGTFRVIKKEAGRVWVKHI